ncbi:MAG: DUF4349 domain-containing protein [Planctomycetes bacterium]|nr:DUF4349 domain-containing protein [Planctomycetota bacterium]MCB9904362.1 DUF4349 domain-containing protein [Planctomycetota bacterium]
MGALDARPSRTRAGRTFGGASVRWGAWILLGAFALGACAEQGAPGAAARAVADSSSSASAAQTSSSQATSEAQQLARKQIQDARLRLRVDSCEAARRAIEDDVASRSGFVSDVDLDHVDGLTAQTVIVLRMPARELAGALRHYAALGTVLREELDTRDITDEFYDVEARLMGARKLEARLLEMLTSDTRALSEVLKVENELARVRETIERYEGKLRLWESLVALSTLTIELVETAVAPVAETPPLTARLGHTFDRSWSALLAVGEALVHLLVAVSPWILPAAFLAWSSVLVSRRMNRRRSNSATPA